MISSGNPKGLAGDQLVTKSRESQTTRPRFSAIQLAGGVERQIGQH
jgi:hypothetical protein